MIKILTLLLLFTFTLNASNDRSLKMMKTEQRIALVIGNNKYSSDRLSALRNPINDAKAMRDKLRSLGFNVFYGENLTVREMDKKLHKFSSKLKNGGVGLFFFAGHGVESRGKNYLMGKDSNMMDKEDIAYESLELNKVVDKMKNSGNRLNIVLLDACRNDPFSRSGGGGLAKINNARGMFIAYATSPGDVASDGRGKHGIFTQEILKNIDSKGTSLHNVFKNVKRDVYNKTNQNQRPWTHDDIIGDFFFKLPTSEISNKSTIKQSSSSFNLNQEELQIKYKKILSINNATDSKIRSVVTFLKENKFSNHKVVADLVTDAFDKYGQIPAQKKKADIAFSEGDITNAIIFETIIDQLLIEANEISIKAKNELIKANSSS